MIRQILSLLPVPVRRSVRVQQRHLADWRQGQYRCLVPPRGPQSDFPVQHTIELRIAPGPTLAAKLHNMRKAIALLNRLDVPPGGLLSFWHVVGNPGKRQGYQPGRNIVNGQLVHDYGGGLCQISSALYELALRTGLDVPERHAHSTNVYTPETTYTPLGLDATLACGYKDLRILNSSPYPFHFVFDLSDANIRVSLCAPFPLNTYPLDVVHTDTPAGLMAEVYRTVHGAQTLVSRDVYRAWKA